MRESIGNKKTNDTERRAWFQVYLPHFMGNYRQDLNFEDEMKSYLLSSAGKHILQECIESKKAKKPERSLHHTCKSSLGAILNSDISFSQYEDFTDQLERDEKKQTFPKKESVLMYSSQVNSCINKNRLGFSIKSRNGPVFLTNPLNWLKRHITYLIQNGHDSAEYTIRHAPDGRPSKTVKFHYPIVFIDKDIDAQNYLNNVTLLADELSEKQFCRQREEEDIRFIRELYQTSSITLNNKTMPDTNQAQVKSKFMILAAWVICKCIAIDEHEMYEDLVRDQSKIKELNLNLTDDNSSSMPRSIEEVFIKFNVPHQHFNLLKQQIKKSGASSKGLGICPFCYVSRKTMKIARHYPEWSCWNWKREDDDYKNVFGWKPCDMNICVT
jgi:hypothetical protein